MWTDARDSRLQKIDAERDTAKRPNSHIAPLLVCPCWWLAVWWHRPECCHSGGCGRCWFPPPGGAWSCARTWRSGAPLTGRLTLKHHLNVDSVTIAFSFCVVHLWGNWEGSVFAWYTCGETGRGQFLHGIPVGKLAGGSFCMVHLWGNWEGAVFAWYTCGETGRGQFLHGTPVGKLAGGSFCMVHLWGNWEGAVFAWYTCRETGRGQFLHGTPVGKLGGGSFCMVHLWDNWEGSGFAWYTCGITGRSVFAWYTCRETGKGGGGMKVV